MTAALLAGAKFIAGLGQSTVTPDCDFETYSEAGYVWDAVARKWRGLPGAPKNKKGLKTVGVEPYVRHPSFDLLSFKYDLKDAKGPRFWRPGLPPPLDLWAYVMAGGVLEAHNAAFERTVWDIHCVGRLGWPVMMPWQWRCSAAKARAHALPGALDNLGDVLQLNTRKDDEGKRLLDKFSKPRNPTQEDPRTRVMPLPTMQHVEAEIARRTVPGMTPGRLRKLRDSVLADHIDTLKLYAYNEADIVSESEASLRIPDLEGEELQWWLVDQAINARGVHIDRLGAEDCVAIIEQAHARYNTELLALTGVDAASKVEQLQDWLRARGLHLDSLDEDAVAEALKRPNLAPNVRRVLEIRAAVGSASVKKAFAIRNRLSVDDRLRELFIFHGARTGRATGEGPQPTNLPKAGPEVIRCGLWVKGEFVADSGCRHHMAPHHRYCPWCGRGVVPRAPTDEDKRIVEWNPDAAEDSLAIMRSRSLALVEWVFGDAMAAVAGALRGLFNAAPGHDLISTDYNSIEAVGLAMLAGEKWRIEVFRTHGKIYETSAAMMYRMDFDEFMRFKKETGQHHPLRQKGKIGELAFGYQGWLGAALAFDMPGTEAEIKADILAWRRASPAIEYLWGGQTLGKLAGIHENAGYPTVTTRWDETPHYFGVEGAAISAVVEPEKWFPVKRLDGAFSGIAFLRRGDVLYCQLPSGRFLTYHRPRLEPSDRGGQALSYEGWNTNPNNGPMGWIRMRTWGGRLVENINQATCRDVLRFACIALEARNYPVVLHVYDEIVSEVAEGYGSNEEFEMIVTTLPDWAKDWPIKAPGGWRAKRYRKG